MGVDLHFCLKKDKRRKEIERIGMSRNFCAFVGNAKNHDRSELSHLERITKLDLSFLIQPEYSDPEEAAYWAELVGQDPKEIKKEVFSSNTFLGAGFFLEKIVEMYDRLTTNSIYSEEMKYFKETWENSYFEGEFLDELNYLIEKLSEMTNKGHKWISIEIAH